MKLLKEDRNAIITSNLNCLKERQIDINTSIDIAQKENYITDYIQEVHRDDGIDDGIGVLIVPLCCIFFVISLFIGGLMLLDSAGVIKKPFPCICKLWSKS